jgi:teichuronic acid biosynthesis glycosyltransferase TuaG
MDLVSVITPLYNGSLFISQAIESVLKQTYDNWEMIIIDDCSTDDSVNIVDKYIQNDSRIKLIKFNKNKGPALARNSGIKIAKGRYIAFLDSDDVWVDKKLQVQIDYMHKHDLFITYSSYYLIDINTKVFGIRCANECINYTDMLKFNQIGNLTGIYDSLKIGKFYMENISHEDYTLWLKIIKKTEFSRGIIEPLAYYRVIPVSVSYNKIRAAIWQWNIYRNIEKIDFFKSLYYLFHYARHGFIRKVRE